MRKVTSLALISLGLFATGQSKQQKIMNQSHNTSKVTNNSVSSQNPLLRKSTLQYQAPEFDKIKDENFKPAFDYGIKEQLKEIDAIANNSEAPTFKNTILALETSGRDYARAILVFSNLNSANTNPTLQKLDEEYAPIFAAHADKIYLNTKLYNRVKKVYDQRNSLNLDPESLRLVEVYEQKFEIAGANLSDAKKQELKQINGQLATLSSAFNNKLLAARKAGALIVSDVKELDGLSQDEIAAAAQDAKNAGQDGKYLLA